MKKWNLVVDVSACTNCQNCVIATQDEYMNNDFPGYSKPGAVNVKVIDIARRVRGSGSMVDVQCVPKMCHHCDDAPCIKASGGVIYKRPDGIVMIDPDKAHGRRDLIDACPHDMIVWNDEQNVPQAWNFDAHLLDGDWDEPRAAQSCPTDAMKAFKISDKDMQALVSTENLQVLHPDAETRPRVYYKNLDPYLHHFIGGNVTAKGRDYLENLAETEVTLSQNETVLMQTKTDSFGDFKFDGLKPDTGGYHISLSHPDHSAQNVTIEESLTESKVLTINMA